MDEENMKRYYSIGEVATMFDVSKSLIRFWENEFTFLKPRKTKKGDRLFTPENIEQFRLIYILVKERGFTLDGAKQEIKRQKHFRKEKETMIKRLTKIRGFLSEL